MKESIWGYMIIVLGVMAILVLWFFANVTNSDQHNYTILKETVESAMLDAVDMAEYKAHGTVRMDEEKFVENLVRRFAENASLSRTYTIEIYDVSETPPKVSLKVSSAENTSINGEIFEYDIVNKLDAILETTY